MKTLNVIHWIVEVVVMAIIASAAGAILIFDFRAFGNPIGTIYTLAQLIVVFTCIPGAWRIKRGIDIIFKWIEKIVKEEA